MISKIMSRRHQIVRISLAKTFKRAYFVLGPYITAVAQMVVLEQSVY